jgi:hypothetical protein
MINESGYTAADLYNHAVYFNNLLKQNIFLIELGMCK